MPHVLQSFPVSRAGLPGIGQENLVHIGDWWPAYGRQPTVRVDVAPAPLAGRLRSQASG